MVLFLWHCKVSVIINFEVYVLMACIKGNFKHVVIQNGDYGRQLSKGKYKQKMLNKPYLKQSTTKLNKKVMMIYEQWR